MSSIVSGLLLIGCGQMPSALNETGSLDMQLWIDQPQVPAPSLAKVDATTWNRLLIAVSGDNMASIIDTVILNAGQQWATAHVSTIPAGSNRVATCWTINAGGDTVHGPRSSSFDLDAGKTASLTMQLSAVRGSIYVNLSAFPANVDSVKVEFVSAKQTWRTVQKKSAKLFLCLDDIPYGSTGKLWIVGFDAQGDTVASWCKDPFSVTGAMVSMNASFVTVGGLGLTIQVAAPGVALVTGSMDTTAALADETGRLIVTEVMYTANDSEYIEVYNPATKPRFDDTLIVQIDDRTFCAFDVSIEPGTFFVIGRDSRDSLTWIDTCPATVSALDLLSGGGNWIVLRARDSTVFDRVAYEGGTNAQEWPPISGKKSIVLDSLSADPYYNNFGRHWQPAKSLIDKSQTPMTLLYGTPGAGGF
jgi:hypothetical protein